MNLLLPASRRMPARRFMLYLPDNNQYGERITTIDERVDEARLLLTQINGGATRLPPACGMWFNEKEHRLIRETTHIVYSHIRVPAFFQHVGELPPIV